ncbi:MULTISPECIES: hypothetical protein [unclassified Leptolyngbya]|uniref:hypothetical protein n=1 Tax=unclassified Leptolyngbya TaxID=2650499 RepID=UPI00168215E7|nr:MULTISPECIES: hypothetical protein [unclassified Leptolyngbya]MBD1910043.1 hypothetical protein [Leptolyngbya sp. FACHB-8]MBD2153060.1 hypothetical protein [Leptolyngbya sp. FACHB-16]
MWIAGAAVFVGQTLGILASLILLPVLFWPLAHTPATSSIPSQVAVMTLPNPIFRRWVHSREEDQGDIRVYRPITYAFPPARMPRDGLEFRQNGEFIRYQPGPSDRSVPTQGQWRTPTENVVEVQFSEQSATPYRLAIVECDGQILKVRETQ